MSPCATTTALMAGKTKAAPERRSQGIPRVSTPYADITQIRFWGLRLSALSAPLSSGAPPSYSVVCSQLCGFAILRVAHHAHVAARWRDKPRDDQDREGHECEDLHLSLLRSGTRLRGAATRRDRGLPRSRAREARRRHRSVSR